VLKQILKGQKEHMLQVQVGYIIKMSLKREYLDIRSCLHDIRLRI